MRACRDEERGNEDIQTVYLKQPYMFTFPNTYERETIVEMAA
jgi:hypothetical protein